jgi:hypothetical protein
MFLHFLFEQHFLDHVFNLNVLLNGACHAFLQAGDLFFEDVAAFLVFQR